MATSSKSALISIFTTLLSLVVIARPVVAQSYNAAGNFSSTSNPNGAWSYGWSYGVGGTFHSDVTNSLAYNGGSLSGWLGNESGSSYIPYILHNGTASPVTIAFTTYQPGQLALQPGDSNEVGIVRWTAPFSGTFTINATFSGLSALGDSADVHILHNGTSLFSSTVNGSPAPAPFSGIQSVLVGDTIDFIVGNETGNPNEDTTALAAILVPEPTTLSLAGLGLGCLLTLRFRKKK
jgi:hypothetical protein